MNKLIANAKAKQQKDAWGGIKKTGLLAKIKATKDLHKVNASYPSLLLLPLMWHHESHCVSYTADQRNGQFESGDWTSLRR